MITKTITFLVYKSQTNQLNSGLSHHHPENNLQNKTKTIFTIKIEKPITRIDEKEMDIIMDRMDLVKYLLHLMDKIIKTTITTTKKETNQKSLEMTIQNLLRKK